MRILIFSDFHGNSIIIERLQNAINYYSPDRIYFLGDIFGYFYDYEKCIDFLLYNNVVCLMGNHDYYAKKILLFENLGLDNLISKYGNGYARLNSKKEIFLNYLNLLKLNDSLELDNIKIAFVHGSLVDNLNGRVYPDTSLDDSFFLDYDIVFCGHTHHRSLKLYNNKIMLNVGSIGQPRDGQPPCFVLYDTRLNCITFNDININFEELIEVVKTNNDDNKSYFRTIIKKLPY